MYIYNVVCSSPLSYAHNILHLIYFRVDFLKENRTNIVAVSVLFLSSQLGVILASCCNTKTTHIDIFIR